jgi:hypothetical protein
MSFCPYKTYFKKAWVRRLFILTIFPFLCIVVSLCVSVAEFASELAASLYEGFIAFRDGKNYK